MDNKPKIRRIIDGMTEADVRSLLCDLVDKLHNTDHHTVRLTTNDLFAAHGLDLPSVRMVDAVNLERFNKLYQDASRQEGWKLVESSQNVEMVIRPIQEVLRDQEDGEDDQDDQDDAASRTCTECLRSIAVKAAGGSLMHLLALYLCGNNNCDGGSEDPILYWPEALRDEKAVEMFFSPKGRVQPASEVAEPPLPVPPQRTHGHGTYGD